MADFGFSYHGKKIHLDVKKCNTILKKTRGLMFRKKSKPLLFIFKKPVKQAIHSFFCLPFIAVWFNGNRIIDMKIVKKWEISIKPQEKFDKLLEIPSDNPWFLLISRRQETFKY